MTQAQLARAGATPEDERRYVHYSGERHMRQAELLAAVVRMCAIRGLWIMQAPASQLLARGWPDVVIVSPFGVLFRALKSEDGDLTRDQIRLLRCLDRDGLNVTVWRPVDLWDGTVERELDGLIGRWRGDQIQVKCEVCGRKVISSKKTRRFCSDRCRSRYGYSERKRKAAGTA